MSCTPATHSVRAKYVVGGVAAHLALARVVDEELGHLAQRAALLAGVGHQTHTAALGALDALLDRMREIGPAGADVRAEHIRAVALVVHACGQLHGGITQVAAIAEDVDGLPADRRQEHLQVRARDEFGIHATGLFEQHAAQIGFAATESVRNPGQMPNRLDRRLGDQRRAAGQQDLAVGDQASFLDGVHDLGHDHMRFGDGDGRADVVAGGQIRGEHVGHHRAPWVEADDLAGLTPLRERADDVGGRRVGEVRLVLTRQRTRCHRQRAVHAVRPAVRADHIAMGALGGGSDERSTLARGRRTPANRRGIEAAAVGGQADMAGGAVRLGRRWCGGAVFSRHSPPSGRRKHIHSAPSTCFLQIRSRRHLHSKHEYAKAA